MLRVLPILVLVAALTACGSSEPDGSGGSDRAPVGKPIDVGLVEGYSARVVVDVLSNPSCVAISPGGRIAVCDSGAGRVLLVHDDGRVTTLVDGFPTEYWKRTPEPRYRIGPLSMVWLDDTRFAVTNGGLPDGEETVLFFDKAGVAGDGEPTNAIPPTTADPDDKGEGNLTGLSRSADGKTLYLCGHGSDARSWLLSVDVEARQLRTFAGTDDHGIATNSPTATLRWRDHTLLALYSGKGAEADSLLIEWDIPTRRPVARWTLPGVTDAYAMARVPGGDQLVIVDHVFDLNEVRPGKLARVSLPAASGSEVGVAQVTFIAARLLGPTGCAFAPDGTLYVTALGPRIDAADGQLIAIDGFLRPAAADAR